MSAPSTAGATTPRPTEDDGVLAAVGEVHLDRVRTTSERFFRDEAESVANACLDLASRFRAGGRLLVLARGPALSDADHVAVEFVHPVIVGKRALPALAVHPADPDALRAVWRSDDIALAIDPGAPGPSLHGALREARTAGLLTLGLFGGTAPVVGVDALDHGFVVPSDDPFVVQEVQETCYHVLWELVHVFLEGTGGSG